MSEDIYVRIAVISDLHCQREENSAKVTRLHNQLPDNPVNRNPVKALKKKIIADNKTVDYFFVLGDITDKADVAGFVYGMDRIKELNTAFKAHMLICTIGNHDMYSGDDNQNPEDTIRNTDDFPFSFKNQETKASETAFWSKGYCFIEDEKCIMFVLNSSKFISSASLNPTEITSSLCTNIEQELDQYKDSSKLKIALTHHHPIPQSDFNDKYSSLDCLNHGDRLIDILNNNNFTIFLHGHKHFPKMKIENRLPIFCSGSFSSLENTSSFNEDNTTHFIDIYKREKSFVGQIETWVFNEINGWKPSTDLEVRFPTTTGFGLDVNTEELAEKLYSHYFKLNEGSNSIYIPVRYEDVIKEYPDIKFLSIDQQTEFEKHLYSKHLIAMNFEKHSFKKTFVKIYTS